MRAVVNVSAVVGMLVGAVLGARHVINEGGDMTLAVAVGAAAGTVAGLAGAVVATKALKRRAAKSKLVPKPAA